MIASHGPARAADACLSAPKAATPQGGHWYYRVERGTKRHCWYLADEHGKSAQAAPPKPSSPPAITPDKPSQTAATTPLQPSVANARAEVTEATNTTPASTAASPSPSPAVAASGGDAPTANAPTSAVSTRWPDSAIAARQAQPAAATPVKPGSQLLGERTEPGPAVRITSAAAPEASSYSMPMLFGSLAGALALAGILGFSVVKFGRSSRFSRNRHRSDSTWDSADTGHSPPWQPQDAGVAPTPKSNPLRTPREVEARSRDIMEILSRASRETAT